MEFRQYNNNFDEKEKSSTYRRYIPCFEMMRTRSMNKILRVTIQRLLEIDNLQRVIQHESRVRRKNSSQMVKYYKYLSLRDTKSC